MAEFRIHRKLQKVLDEKGYELFGLRKMAADKRKNVLKYVPVPDDPVDVALAAFSNSSKVRIPFIRETSEIYLFGTRRVHISLFNGRLCA